MVVTRSRSRSLVASQPQDTLGLIAEHLLPGDLADLARFRAVCKNWRLSTDHLDSRADVLVPRDWVLLSQPRPFEFEFFNTASGKFFSASIPRALLRQGYSLHSTVGCYLFLEKSGGSSWGSRSQSRTMALLNLFTGFFVELPPTVVSARGEGERDIPFPNMLAGGYVNSKGAMFFLEKFSGHNRLLWKKLRSDTWFYSQFGISCFNYFFDNNNDWLYGIDPDKGLVRVNLFSADERAAGPVFEVLAHGPQMYPEIYVGEIVESACVFNCGGTIVAVLFLNDDSEEYQSYEKFGVCKFNTEARRFVGTKDTNGHAIFISQDKSLVISCTKLVGVYANSIVFCGLIGGEIIRCNLRDDKNQSCSYRPNTIANELVRYCYDGWGEEDAMEME